MKLTANKTNFEEVFETLVVGCIKAQNYNSESFSMSEVQRARAMDYVLDKFIDKTIESGYCHYSILGPILSKYNYNLESSPVDNAKKEIDDDFFIDMSEYEQAMKFSYAVFEETSKAIKEGGMKVR